jgi:hypothetical protein
MVRWLASWWVRTWRARSGTAVGAATTSAAIPVELGERTIELEPLPAEFNRPLKLKSQAAPEQFYEVNLASLSCTCRDFAEHRRDLPARDIRRVCKHLRMLLERRATFEYFGEVAQAILRPSRSGSRVHHGVREAGFVAFADPAGGEIVLGFEPGSPWVSVVTRRGTNKRSPSARRYTYNVADGRWANGVAPATPADITHVARELADRRRVAA